jgi:hypothetical protein
MERPRARGLGIALACWLAIAGPAALAGGPETIAWRTDLRAAEVEARAQNRLLWIQFTGAWCPNCVRLERESFVDPRIVGHARQSFIPVRITSDQHEELVERFRLEGIPATIVLSPAGQVITRHEGYVDATTFGAFLERALIQAGRMPGPQGPAMARTIGPPTLPGRSLPAAIAADTRSRQRR